MYPEPYIDARHLIADPVFLDLFTGRVSSSWRHTANPEVNVLTTAEVIDLMTELTLHMTREIVRLTSLSPSRTSTELIWIYPLTFKSEPNSTVESRDGVEVCEGPGICITLRYVVSTDGKNKIGDAVRIQNTALVASRLFDDPVSRSVCCSLLLLSFPGIGREWGRTANPEYNVLTIAEVTDMLPELKLLHMTKEIVQL